MSHAHRLLLKWARLVHVYLTLFGLLLVLFFAATGFLLNHAAWFDSDEPFRRTTTGNVSPGLLDDPHKNEVAIIELLRKDFAAIGARDSFEVDDDRVIVIFKSPGQDTTATIRRRIPASDGLEDAQDQSYATDGQATVVHE
jgi:uncharacterized protein